MNELKTYNMKMCEVLIKIYICNGKLLCDTRERHKLIYIHVLYIYINLVLHYIMYYILIFQQMVEVLSVKLKATEKENKVPFGRLNLFHHKRLC